MYKNILVPVDVGNLGPVDKMLEVAKRLLTDDGRITLVNVVESVPDYVAAELPGDIGKKGHDRAKSALDEVVRAKDLDVNAVVLHGHSAAKILEFAEQSGTNMIIIGSHKPEVMDLLLGSTAARVVRKSKCSVHVVR
ncbi:universal stress protein [Lentilitoribacter sp. EG35]|jgi:nucleotide-binding universal stress UspA family protein|uniref:universal stress protein n=1 Tax=Lentilitoribacter sp. EG35 TaxID=3234192 RepID=UPI00345F64CB